MRHLSKKRVQEFQRTVLSHYKTNGRRFPWRETHDAYKILVSEVMLQQTQAPRVVEFFKRFVRVFPSAKALAQAPVADVIRLWKGLGYNRRALNLYRAAQAIVSNHGGVVPSNLKALDELPGVGKYTAAAVLAFSFNRPTVFIETNIRTAYLHYFLKGRKNVEDSQIFDLVEETLYTKNPRLWYQALMDYGAMIKQTVGNENLRSKHYSKQPAFRGSVRELRGELLAQAIKNPITPKTLKAYSNKVDKPISIIKNIAETLVSEGFLRHVRDTYRLV